jgi:hypothetical protein
MYENRQFAIFATSELDKIDFTQVLETSVDTVRKSVDGTKTFVKWDSEEIPTCIQELTTLQGYYTYEQMLELLNTSEWSSKEQSV